jgi:thiosulfate/3-mercaptopyruvate sulfurtransferase
MAASTAAAPVSPLIDVEALAGLVESRPGSADSGAPVLLDIRWSLLEPDGRPAYLAGHLPGARYVDLEHELSGPANPSQGRHPLPHPADLQAALRRAGVRSDSLVVVYDDAGGLSAARAWWLLRWAGHAGVRVLDGGLDAWRAAGRTMETGAAEPSDLGGSDVGDLVIRPGAWPTVSAEEVAARHPARVLIDSRAAERYRGDVEPVDPVAGHIPGAVNRPTTENLGPDGRFLDPAQLQAGFADLGVTPSVATPDGEAVPIVYCGSGVTAAHQLLAMEVAGLAGVLYAPSWSGWVSDPTRPVATAADLP